MKKQYLLTTVFALGLAVSAQAQTTIYSFGPSTTYTDVGRTLEMEDGTTDATSSSINRGFNTVDMSPNSPSYLGPEFFGGWETSGSLAQNFDFSPQVANDQALSGGNDGPFFTLNNTTGSTGQFAYLMMGTTAATDFGDLDTFTLQATRDTGTGKSGIAHAVIRVGTDYFVADTSSNNVGSGTTPFSLDLTDWNNYDPGTSIATIGSATTLNANDQVDAVGFLLFLNATDTLATGNFRVGVGEFSATAVPEPTTYALLAGALALGAVMLRRRQV